MIPDETVHEPGMTISIDVNLLARTVLAAAAQAWDEGRKHGATYPYGERGLATDDNPYRKGR